MHIHMCRREEQRKRTIDGADSGVGTWGLGGQPLTVCGDDARLECDVWVFRQPCY